MASWRTNLGGAISTLATALTGTGVLGLHSGYNHTNVMWWTAFSGFVLSGVGKAITALFAADAADVRNLRAQTATAISTGDVTPLTANIKPLNGKPPQPPPPTP